MPKTKTKQVRIKLSKIEAEAIIAVEGGADVNNYGMAQALRAMQRRGLAGADGLFEITAVQNDIPEGAERPYMGAIARRRGLVLARRTLKQK